MRRLLLTCLLLFPVACPAQSLSSWHLRRGDSLLEVQVSPQFDARQREELRHWIEVLSESLLQVFGRWPRKQWQITVVPISASSSDPIPWAKVVRGEVDRVEFFTIPNPERESLSASWTGYHELAHLLIPYRGSGDIWFSEGLASYYQNLLRARSGQINEQQLWQKLHNGFERGRRDRSAEGMPLSAASDSMRATGAYMRVHWSGAWYFLSADTRLRLQSEGRMDLDQALEKLNRCCADLRLSVAQMAQRLDELNGVALFEPLYRELASSTEVPDHRALFRSLGVTINGDRVTLQHEGPEARLRAEFSAPKSL